MIEFVVANETAVRLGLFATVLALMMGWEVLAPRREREAPRIVRWFSNLGLVAVNAVVLRLLFPIAAVGTAAVAAERGWGLFHGAPVPEWVAIVLSVAVLDLAIYAQHVTFHKVPLLWRLHRVHHADVDVDATTGVRFHPIEIVLSMLFKMAVVVALGAPVISVIVFEVVLNAMAMFNHGNVNLPESADRLLRLAIVTPDFHRVHHSVYRDETDSNYGFNLSAWDRVFGTYRAQPRDGHKDMKIGLEVFRERQQRYLHRLLVQPFVRN